MNWFRRRKDGNSTSNQKARSLFVAKKSLSEGELFSNNRFTIYKGVHDPKLPDHNLNVAFPNLHAVYDDKGDISLAVKGEIVKDDNNVAHARIYYMPYGPSAEKTLAEIKAKFIDSTEFIDISKDVIDNMERFAEDEE